MSRDSKIEWTGDTWQFVSGCEDASPGCANCYAKRQAHRMGANPNPKISGRYRGLTVLRGNGPQWTGAVRQLPDQLEVPLHRKTPTTFFCNSLSDTFHEDVNWEFIAAALGVMSATPRHTYQLLTKRAERLPEFFAWFAAHRDYGRLGPLGDHAAGTGDITGRAGDAFNVAWRESRGTDPSWPLNNVWLGVSVENKKHGVLRIRHLQRTPAAVRFLSIEPLLEDLGEIDLTGIHWVIVGGESGHGARRCDVGWIRNVLRQCRAQGVPCFVKQLGARPVDSSRAAIHQPCMHEGKPAIRTTVHAADAPEVAQARIDEHDASLRLAAPQVEHPLCLREHFRYADPKGGDMAEWPQDLRVREMPARGGDTSREALLDLRVREMPEVVR